MGLQPVTIREATAEDAEGIAAANIEMARETEGIELDPPTVAAGVAALLVDPAKGRYFLAEEAGGRVVGQLMITLEWSDWRNSQCWWIQSVYVVPKARRQGVYKALYGDVKRRAGEAGAAGVRLYADTQNERAHAAYAALGMRSHYVVFEDMFTGF